jgi:hypothetical protein
MGLTAGLDSVKIKSLSLPGVKPRFGICSAHSLVTKLTELFGANKKNTSLNWKGDYVGHITRLDAVKKTEIFSHSQESNPDSLFIQLKAWSLC